MHNATQGVIALVSVIGLGGMLAYCIVTWVADIRRRTRR